MAEIKKVQSDINGPKESPEPTETVLEDKVAEAEKKKKNYMSKLLRYGIIKKTPKDWNLKKER